MTAIILLILCFFSLFSKHSNDGDCSSKTFFKSIMPFSEASCERISLYPHVKNVNKDFIFQITPFYQQSNQETEKLSVYFFPYGDSILTFANNADFYKVTSPIPASRKDVDLNHFGFTTAVIKDEFFESLIELELLEKMYGVGLLWRKGLYKNEKDLYKFHLELSSPLMFVEHQINVIESIHEFPTSEDYKMAYKNISSILNNNQIKYGKIESKKKMKQGGLGDVSLNLVYSTDPNDNCSTETYIGLLFPTGNVPGKCGNKFKEFLWEPIIGNGGHYGLKYGTNLDILISQTTERKISFMVHADTTFLFPNHQYRLFSLKGKDFSQYMEVWPSKKMMLANQSDTLANYLFLKCTVSPYFMINSTASFLYQRDIFKIMAGYNFFVRQAEKISIEDNIQSVCLKGASSTNNNPQVTIARTIDMQYSAEDQVGYDTDPGSKNPYKMYDLFHIRARDINKNAATHDAVFSGAFFGYIEYSPDEHKEWLSIGIGASYRFESNNTALPASTVWGSVHIQY